MGRSFSDFNLKGLVLCLFFTAVWRVWISGLAAEMAFGLVATLVFGQGLCKCCVQIDASGSCQLAQAKDNVAQFGC